MRSAVRMRGLPRLRMAAAVNDVEDTQPHLRFGGYVQILHSAVLIGHRGHLVEVRGKQAGRLNGLDDVLGDGPRQSEAVECRGSCGKRVHMRQKTVGYKSQWP